MNALQARAGETLQVKSQDGAIGPNPEAEIPEVMTAPGSGGLAVDGQRLECRDVSAPKTQQGEPLSHWQAPRGTHLTVFPLLRALDIFLLVCSSLSSL